MFSITILVYFRPRREAEYAEKSNRKKMQVYYLINRGYLLLQLLFVFSIALSMAYGENKTILFCSYIFNCGSDE